MIVLSMDYPYGGPRPLQGLRVLAALPALRRTAFDTFEAALRGVDYLASRPDVDPGRIVVLGVSLGSLFAVAVGAHDPRVAAVVLIYGGGDLGLVARRNLERWGVRVPSFVVRPIVSAFFGEFEPLAHVERISPRHLLMIASDADEMFPPASATALYEAAREPKNLVWYDTEHLDLFDPALIRRLTTDVITALRAARILPGPEALTPRSTRSAHRSLLDIIPRGSSVKTVRRPGLSRDTCR
jgi:fermentation-respiration switch protein FrsA (DUF1100 family)